MTTSYLIVGLGNPGREYRENRHNVGFMLLDLLARDFKVRFSRMQSRALVASAASDHFRFILAKPQTFMNLSGSAVKGLMHSNLLPLSNMLVAYDDLDLPLGTIRLRPDGGSAGHKGMISIIDKLGTAEFARIRIGIGRPPGHLPPPEYVLQDFSPAEKLILAETLTRARDAVRMWVSDGLDQAMTRFNMNPLDPDIDT